MQKYLRIKYTVPAALLGTLLWFAQPAICSMSVTTANEQGVTIEYSPDVLNLDVSNKRIIHLSLRGGDFLRVPNMPELPVYIATVAIPPGSNPSVRLLTFENGTVLKGTLPVFEQKNPDPIQQYNLFWPSQGEIVGPLEIRSLSGLRVVRIPIYPARTTENQSSVELAKKVTFRVDFGRYEKSTTRQPLKLNKMQKAIVINHKQALKWGRQRISNFISNNSLQGEYLYRFEIMDEAVYRMTFEELRGKGVEFPENGLPSTHIKLYGNGGGDLSLDPGVEAPLGLKECAIHIEDGNDNIFGPGDWLLFYGRGAGGYVQDSQQGWRYAINHYSTTNYYWLNIHRSDPSSEGLRMDTFSENILPDTVVSSGISRYYTEPERFIFNYVGFSTSGLEWYGYTFDGISRITYPFNLSSPDTSLPANIRLRIVNSQYSPYIVVRLNGEHVDEYPPGRPSNPAGHLIPSIQSLLNVTSNSIALEQVTDGAEALFDWLEVSYHGNLDHSRIFEEVNFNGAVDYMISDLTNPWVFNITDHNNVAFVHGNDFIVQQDAAEPRRYLLASTSDFAVVNSPFEEYFPSDNDIENLADTTNWARVLLITPDGYWDEVEPLLDYYSTRFDAANAAKRVRLSEIYNTFSGGLRDPAAIRNFLMYANDYWIDPPDYVMFCGDGDYNYRDINRPFTEDFLPPYEYTGTCSDDWFVDFTPTSEDGVRSYPLPEMSHGRLTAQNAQEMKSIVDKIIAYVEEPEFGPWRNRVTLVADDEFGDQSDWEADHVTSTEMLSSDCIPTSFDRVKIYLTEYERQWGREKPQAAEDLLESINTGTLLVNFMGHGNSTLWAHEHVFVLSRDLPRITPSRRLPLYLAYTCDWSFWDDPASQSFPEQLLALSGRGAIGIIASTRLTGPVGNRNIASNFFNNMFNDQKMMTIGEALMLAKHQYMGSNSTSYHLLGEPSMYIGAPQLTGEFTSISDSTLQPLALSSIVGVVHDNQGQLEDTFNGQVEFIVRDTEVPRHHAVFVNVENSYYIHLYYNLSGPTVYRGLFSLNDGRFEGRFVVPRDVTLGGDLGRVMAYFYNESVDGVIVMDSVAYSDQVADAVDNQPPEIDIFLGNRAFRAGDVIGPEPLLIVDLEDSSGLNLTGAMGHGINVSIDDSQPIDLTPFFRYELDSHQSGSLEKQIGPLSSGIHKIEIQAWDSFNNLAVTELDVDVTAEAGGLKVERIFNWPNPLRDETELTFTVTRIPADYKIKIFTVGGRKIWDYQGRTDVNYVRDAVWNGRDSAGRLVGNGVYLYQVSAWDDDGNHAEGLGRIAVIR